MANIASRLTYLFQVTKRNCAIEHEDYKVSYLHRLPYFFLSVSVTITIGCTALSMVVVVTCFRPEFKIGTLKSER